MADSQLSTPFFDDCFKAHQMRSFIAFYAPVTAITIQVSTTPVAVLLIGR